MASLPTLLLLAQAAGTTASALSSYREGKAEQSAYKRQAAIDVTEAERSREVATQEALDAAREGARLKARQNVLYAKSGVKAGTGTPLVVSDYTNEELARRGRIIMEQGEYGYEYRMSKAAGAKKMARSAGKKAMWKAGTTLATGLGQGLETYMKYKK